jgi:hypothetical protein
MCASDTVSCAGHSDVGQTCMIWHCVTWAPFVTRSAFFHQLYAESQVTSFGTSCILYFCTERYKSHSILGILTTKRPSQVPFARLCIIEDVWRSSLRRLEASFISVSNQAPKFVSRQFWYGLCFLFFFFFTTRARGIRLGCTAACRLIVQPWHTRSSSHH